MHSARKSACAVIGRVARWRFWGTDVETSDMRQALRHASGYMYECWNQVLRSLTLPATVDTTIGN